MYKWSVEANCLIGIEGFGVLEVNDWILLAE